MILNLVHTYLGFNLLLFVGLTLLVVLTIGLNALKIDLRSAELLKIHYFALTGVIFFSVLNPFLPKSYLFEPIAKVQTFSPLDKNKIENSLVQKLSSPVPKQNLSEFPLFDLTLILFSMALGLTFIITILKFSRDLNSLRKIKLSSHLIRRIGRVEIFSNRLTIVPFSFLTASSAVVVVPEAMLANYESYKISVMHELQHHRQKDTLWAFVILAIKLMAPFNPFIFLWNKWLSEIQEYACDETLVDRKKVETQAYKRCLVEVAQNCFNQKTKPVSATGISFLVGTQFLKRRILKMNTKTSTMKRSMVFSIRALVISLFAFTTYASKGAIQDRRLTLQQVKSWAESYPNSDFPIVVNDKVVDQINDFIGTPEGRKAMKASLERMETYRTEIGRKITEYRVPAEIMAIPLVESGYKNLEENNKKGWGAGLWMFIKSTAKTYGMKVDETQDQRLNVGMQTDAAMRYLSSNYLRFKDWHLSVLAYNIGENRVQKGIDKTGSKDAWVLIENKFENDRNYLPKVMAAVLIMNNPKSLE